MLRPKEVCQRLGISYATLREYVKKGYIKPVVLETGKWRFREEDVEKLMGIVRKRKVILYARVSSNTQKDDLVNQVKYLDRQLNASLNIYLKMCGFPHIRDIPRVWVGVIPLKGRRGMNGALPRDSGEAQRLRIDIKYYEIL